MEAKLGQRWRPVLVVSILLWCDLLMVCCVQPQNTPPTATTAPAEVPTSSRLDECARLVKYGDNVGVFGVGADGRQFLAVPRWCWQIQRGEFVREVSSPVTHDSRLRFSPARSNSHLACGELAGDVRHDEHSRRSIYSGSL
uniref:Secreted protein n=1 Tax=Opuntia streptacantha TaxID=393608 RepID=A0A7C8Z6X9_OPUST